jgi:ribosome-binding factor A
MTNSRRRERVGGLIAGYVATLFVTKVKDPRLNSITVTRAEVSPDLKKAKVFFSVLGGVKERKAAETALKKATGFIRSKVGENLELRTTPEIVFIFDKNPAHAQRIFELLAEDKELREGASKEDSPPINPEDISSQGSASLSAPDKGAPEGSKSSGEDL